MRTARRLASSWPAALLIGLVLLSGCAPSAAAGNQAARTTQVSMPPSYRFDPAAIEVTAGATVTWTNHDNFTHNVHITSGAQWTSQPLRPGESVSYTFTAPGEYRYVCDFHAQDMKGSVLVK